MCVLLLHLRYSAVDSQKRGSEMKLVARVENGARWVARIFELL